MPIQALNPGIPRTPSAVETGASSGSSRRSDAGSVRAYSRQPVRPITQSPSASCVDREAITCPTAAPGTATPSAISPWPGRVELRCAVTRFMNVRRNGSTDR
jgi:hypothetical protein